MKAYKKVPEFWWDFYWQGKELTHICIESDIPDKPIITKFPIVGKYADKEISRAEALIEALNAGRITIKQAQEAQQ